MIWFIIAPFIIFGYMSLLWLLALQQKKNSVADVGWGIGFLILALLSFVTAEQWYFRNILVTLLVFLWGTRLSWRILMRNLGKGEDPRYAAWRTEWQEKNLNIPLMSYLQVFLLQGLMLVIIASPILLINQSVPSDIALTDLVGLLIWGIGYCFEVVGDYQLDLFLSRPENRGKILTTGLWYYSRHPNYFGEALMWWGIWIISLAIPYGLLTIISPITITYLLRYVSGVPPLEKLFEGHKEYEAYKKRTSVFIPWWQIQ